MTISAGRRRLYNVALTYIQLHDVASTSVRRYIDVAHVIKRHKYVIIKKYIDSTPVRCIDVNATLYKRHEPAGNILPER